MSFSKQQIQSLKTQPISLKIGEINSKFDFSRNKIKQKSNYKVKGDFKFKNFQKKRIVRISKIKILNFAFLENKS